MMVIIMSIAVVPFGVLAALYLREYAKEGTAVRLVRIAVNNLAGVPSIVYGVFGLGFFVYAIGGSIDALFFPESLPAPTFGTGGILWASFTLALLTVPVVIVATEEGLAAVPRDYREASLGLGATKFETIWRVVLPSAVPAILTGLILAIARAAGEVAPLMLTGVVKLAPTLPLDGTWPFFHFDPFRSQIHASRLPYLRRGLPVAERRSGEADGLRYDPGLDRRRDRLEPDRDHLAKPSAQEVRGLGRLRRR
jgi:phosphate transport system permease protein